MSGNEELQDLSQQLQAVEDQLEALEGQMQQLQSTKQDIDEAIEALETLETGSNVQVPVGGGAYVNATIEDIDEVIVSIGGGYASEQNQSKAISLLDDRKDLIDEQISEVTSAISELEEQGQQLGQRAQQQLQQQQQQRQNQPGPGGP